MRRLSDSRHVVVDVVRLAEEGEMLEGELDPGVLELGTDDCRLEEGVRYRLHALVVDDELIVRGSLRLRGKVRCVRCAEFYEIAVEDPAFSCVRELSAATESEELTSDIREAIILAFPSYPVCGEDCKGLCSQCGANRNKETCECKRPADRRWDDLDGLGL